MKFKVMQPVEIEVRYVRCVVPLREDDELPDDLPARDGSQWDFMIDLGDTDNDKIRIPNWSYPEPVEVHIKVCDAGKYTLLDSSLNQVGKTCEDYVPHAFVPGRYGDYIEMSIATDGVISGPSASCYHEDLTPFGFETP